MELFWKRLQNGGTFHEEVGELLAKNLARTAKRQLDGRHLLFADLNNPLSPKFADKHALSKMNLTSMEVNLF